MHGEGAGFVDGGGRPHVRFISTYEPAVPLFEAVFPALEAKGLRVTAVISRAPYRRSAWLDSPDTRSRYLRTTWVPTPFLQHKRTPSLLYYCTAPYPILNERSDLDIYVSEPPMFYAGAPVLSGARRIPHVVYLMDLQLEVLGAAYGYRGVGMFVSRLATDWALRRARAVFVLGRCMRERVRRAGVPPERIRVLHNWASVEPQGCHLGDEFRQRHGLLGKFVVMYAGNLGLAHQFETILRSAAALRPDSRIAFVFVGHGMRRPEVAAVSAAGASSVYVVDSQPRSELAEVLSAADLHFISLRPGCEGLMVPSKFYGALAAARPVLYEGEGSGEVARLITEINCGTVVAPGDSAALTGAVSRYLQYPEERARAGSAAAAAYRTRFSRNIGSGEIVKEIQQLLRGVHRG